MSDAFEILVREYHRMVFGYLLALVSDSHLAEDLTQETFIVVHRRMADYDRSRDFGAWVRGIARNLALAEARRSQRYRFIRLDRVERVLSDSFASPDEAAPELWRRRSAALRACLEKGEEWLRQVLDLHYVECLKAADVAKKLGVAVETVWKRLSRGRMVLRECVEKSLREGGFPS
jgi:RNA polymerase sigma-70 factor